MSDLALTLKSVHKSYGARKALDGLEFQVTKGQVFGLLGPNGAGKTTTLRLLLGALKADSGDVSALGYCCWRERATLKTKMGYLSTDTQLYPWLNAKVALSLFSEIRDQDLGRKGMELCEKLNLSPELEVGKMSRGNRQKLGLVLALAHHPELVILDEPSSGFDPLVQSVFAELIRDKSRDGATVLLSSHTFAEVDELCDEIAIVKEGRVICQDQLAQIRRRAPRKIKIVFSDKIPDTLPPELELLESSDSTLRGQWKGKTGGLLSWCHTHSIDDIEISPPLLNDAFLEFYR